jgi:serine/threonine protein kinase/tetratricopeptide (TPR) repeat protein
VEKQHVHEQTNNHSEGYATMNSDSTFGAEPNQLQRLFEIGLEKDDDDEVAPDIKRWDLLKEKPGSRIGPYRITQVLGEGGMGIVYLAEQHKPVKRQVAVKIIKPGMDSKRVITRFEAERQALAFMDHPNIAHVYDAGTTELGRPYFVMEYVKGLSITDYCDHHKLTIEDRLNLFLQICQAVHHAHQKGIIHRDIKPSNILVSVNNNRPIPKIIDFGVAKAIDRSLTDRTMLTEDSQLLGTPEYMSPEQADMVSEDIDIRSDIYSLGVLLYVLLTGVLPFGSDTLRTGGIEHIRQIIRETDPKTPSTRLSSLGEEAKKVALSRRTEIATLAKKLHKELEWIPLKAMRKDRAERYRSASELIDDINNYLHGAPLIAGPPGTVYHVKKFIQRNRTVLAGIAAVLVIFIGGLIASGIFAIGRIRARAEAQAVSDFLTTVVMPSANPNATLNESILSVLDAISEGLEGKFEDWPLIEAAIHYQLGQAYWRFGQLYRAGQLKTLEGHLDTVGEHLDTYLQHLDTAEEHLKRALLLEEIPKNKVEPMGTLGYVYIDKGRLDEAERQCREAVEWGQRHLGAEHETTLWCMNALALLYMDQKRYEESESLFREMIEISLRVFGEGHLISLLSRGNLAGVYIRQGRYDEAERLLLRLKELKPDIVHYEYWEMTLYMQELATIYAKRGRFDEAEPIFLKVLENRRIKRGNAHRDTLRTLQTIADFYKDQQRYEKAEPLMLRAVWGRRITLSDEHPDTLESLNNLIDLYEAWNKPEQAEQWRAKLLQPAQQNPQ